MGSINLEVDDVFDRSHSYESDGDFGYSEENSGKVPQTENDDISENLSKLTRESTRKRVSKPKPKLDVERLKSSRGLSAIPKMFEKIHFRGKGHEVQDLELLMSSLEHWGHRLMPNMPFYELTERLEKLGAKKDVQTCIKRIRLDLPFFTGDVQEESEDQAPEVDVIPQAPIALDDSMDAAHNSIEVYNSSILMNNSAANDSMVFPSTPAMNTSANLTLTQEQKERIERNRQLALQRRMQKSACGAANS